MSPCKQLMKELQALLFIDLSKVLSNFVQNKVFIPSDSIIFFPEELMILGRKKNTFMYSVHVSDSFIQPIINDQVLYARQCARAWEYRHYWESPYCVYVRGYYRS